MALQEVTASFIRRLRLSEQPVSRAWSLQCRRLASTSASQENVDLETTTFHQDSPAQGDGQVAQFNPLENAQKRQTRLPASRYKFRPPKYYRGPLHPHQPPKASDPSSREFYPGPFSLPRLEQTYHDTLASDLMTLSYTHFPPGYQPHQKGERLRQWVGDSPYFKNRPLREPRGGDVLSLLRRRTTFRNIPQLERVTVHSMVKQATDDSAHLHIAGMAVQAITNVRVTTHMVKKSLAMFGIREGQYLSVTAELEGENMFHFLSKVIDVVMPRIKEYKGVKGSSGDSSGNIAFGLKGEEVAMFPEIEVNYDMYPPKQIPGCHIIVHTSATNDRDARMLLSSIGMPFYGKLVN